MVQLAIEHKPDDCVVIGQYHCRVFFQLLHNHHNAPYYLRAQTWREFEEHLDTCPTCQAWLSEPQQYEVTNERTD